MAIGAALCGCSTPTVHAFPLLLPPLRTSHGYFDPGVGRLIDIWGFGANKTTQRPTQLQVQQALANSSMASDLASQVENI
jgi:hypothetical protein